jgi:hypothetical protein
MEGNFGVFHTFFGTECPIFNEDDRDESFVDDLTIIGAYSKGFWLIRNHDTIHIYR